MLDLALYLLFLFLGIGIGAGAYWLLLKLAGTTTYFADWDR